MVKPIRVTAPNRVFALGGCPASDSIILGCPDDEGAQLPTVMDMTRISRSTWTMAPPRRATPRGRRHHPWLREHFGNPASRSHAWGWEAEEAVEKARVQVAELIGADPREIVWTSGATDPTTSRSRARRTSTSRAAST